jgi:hypothetical protein
VYQIRLKGHLSAAWAAWFGDAMITLDDTGDTMLTCTIADQAELHGVLKRVRDLGIPLVYVMRVESQDAARGLQCLDETKFMKTYRVNAVLIGAFFLISTVAYLTGTSVFVEPALTGPEYLASLDAHKTQLVSGLLLEVVNAIAVVGISTLFFPVLHKQSAIAAIGYVSARVIEAVLLLGGVISQLLLLPISQVFVGADPSAAAGLRMLAELAIQTNASAFQLAMLVLGAGSLLLCSALLRSRLIPWPLAALGLIGYVALIVSALWVLLGNPPQVVLFIPGGLFELALPIWLIAKGFRTDT